MINLDKTTLGPVPDSALSVMRHAGPLLRTAAGVVITTFTMWILAPTAEAAQMDTPPAPPARTLTAQNGTPAMGTPPPATPEAKMSHSIQNLGDALWRADEAMKKGDQQKADKQLARIGKLGKEVNQLETEVMKAFAANEAHIKTHKLAKIIMDRHQKAVASVKADMAALKQHLTTVEKEKGKGKGKSLQAAIQKARAHLQSKQQKTKRRVFDPNNMPRKVMQPIEGNTPKKKREDFIRAGLTDLPTAKLAALGDFTFDQLPGADDPAYLAETDEVLINDAIKAKAAELNHDPVAIYNWVRNTIEWLPTWGATQTSAHTLGSGKGNAMDISSLLIALYRASGIPARYVHGTIDVPIDKYMNWAGGFTDHEAAIKFAASGGIPADAIVIGGKITHARMEHIWAEAAIDFEPSRGAINKAADAWVQMDASFKQYVFHSPVDISTLFNGMNFDELAEDFLASGLINREQGWAQGPTSGVVIDLMAELQPAMRDWLGSRPDSAKFAEITGGGLTIVQDDKGFAGGLPNRYVVKGLTYDHLPASLQYRVTIELGKQSDLSSSSRITLPFAKLNNQKVAVSFNPSTESDYSALRSLFAQDEDSGSYALPSNVPGYMINVTSKLRLNDQVIAVGDSQTLGTDFILAVSFELPSRGIEKSVSLNPSGSLMSLLFTGGSLDVTKFRSGHVKAVSTADVIASADPKSISSLDEQGMLEEIFNSGLSLYMAQYMAYVSSTKSLMKGHLSVLPTAGSYGYVHKVEFFYGIPLALSPGGVQMDLNQFRITSQMSNGDEDDRKLLLSLEGVMSSLLESEVSEQLFNPREQAGIRLDGVSAAKVLRKARESNQRTYFINQENAVNLIPNLGHYANVMEDISNALESGKVVITHESPISLPGWSGSGYVIIDPETGSDAYMIGGGQYGGYYSGFILGWGISLSVSMLTVPFMAGNAIASLLILAAALIVVYAWLSFVSPRLGVGCFLSGMGDGSEVASWMTLGAGLAAMFTRKMVTKLDNLLDAKDWSPPGASDWVAPFVDDVYEYGVNTVEDMNPYPNNDSDYDRPDLTFSTCTE